MGVASRSHWLVLSLQKGRKVGSHRKDNELIHGKRMGGKTYIPIRWLQVLSSISMAGQGKSEENYKSINNSFLSHCMLEILFDFFLFLSLQLNKGEIAWPQERINFFIYITFIISWSQSFLFFKEKDRETIEVRFLAPCDPRVFLGAAMEGLGTSTELPVKLQRIISRASGTAKYCLENTSYNGGEVRTTRRGAKDSVKTLKNNW